MITIHYSEFFDEGVYTEHTHDNKCSVNTMWLGSMGLLGFLEREFGLTGNYTDTIDRTNTYSAALKRHLITDPDAFYAKAFETDEMGVTKDLLRWRDDLVFLGWKNMNAVGQPFRLRTLALVEQNFCDQHFHFGIPDRWQNILNSAGSTSNEFDIIILVYDNPEQIHPFYRKLFNCLGEHIEFKDLNTTISIKDNNLGIIKSLLLGKAVDKGNFRPLCEDQSFSVLHLKDNHVAAELMADQIRQGFRPVVINDDNKILDYYLMSNGLPASGSRLDNSNPLIVQLFKLIAVSLTGPLNVFNLLSLLQCPYSPIPKPLASNLARKLIEKPGVNNSDWKESINRYFSDQEVSESDRNRLKTKQEEVELLLNFNFDQTAETSRVKSVYAILKNWADKHSLPEIYKHSDEERNQFAYLSSLSEGLLSNLMDEGEAITSMKLMKLIEGIYQPASFPNQSAQACTVERVASPACLLGNPSILIWLDCYNSTYKTDQLTFLYQEEVEFLTLNGIEIYLPSHRVKHIYEKDKRGILSAVEQCLLVIVEKHNGASTTLHPLIAEILSFLPEKSDVQCQISDIEIITKYKPHYHFTSESKLPPEKLRWKINNPENFTRRDLESASSIDTLIQHPFEWVIRYQGRLNTGNSFTLPDLFTLKGIIAHATTASILNLYSGNANFLLTDSLIREHLDEKIREEGLVFLLTEMKFEYEELARKYTYAIQSLLEIIRENDLKVVGCEYSRENHIDGIGKVAGTIDLVLERKGGQQVIFDLKWTKNNKKYQTKVEEGKDIQLAIYHALLNNNPHTAYFMFDSGKLYTRHTFIGNNVITVNVTGILSEKDVLSKASNSFTYRWEELAKGDIEIGDNAKLEDLAYFNETDDRSLIPLDSDKKNKYADKYSGLELFKGKIY